jgi:transcriptional regulator with XRE-family HTH domain
VGVSPVVRRRRLAAELRRLRTVTQMTLDDVAQVLECSAAKVRRIETGQVGARIQDVRELLRCYGVSDPERDVLLALVRHSRGRGWWQDYSDFVSDEFQTYVGLEHEASIIYTYEVYLIPGLLQTERYAATVMGAHQDCPLSDVERGLSIRMTRQRLLEGDEPPRLWAVVHERALERATYGPKMMVEQYERLISIAVRPTVTLQVLPSSAGAHPRSRFSYTILGFSNPADPPVVYAELLTSAHHIRQAEAIDQYQIEFDRLRGRALDPAESVALIKARAASLAR